MSQAYSNPKDAKDPHRLPDVWITQLTAAEQAEQDEDLMHEASKKFRLASMNSGERDKAIEWAIEESGAKGGWFWCYCFPGCMPESGWNGPFKTERGAFLDMRKSARSDRNE